MVKQWSLRVNVEKAKYEFLEVESNGMERSRYNSTDLGIIWDATLLVFDHRDSLDGINASVTLFPADKFSDEPRMVVNTGDGYVYAVGDSQTIEGVSGLSEFFKELYVVVGGTNG